MSKNVFLHVDLDAFFASVEQLDNPEYRGKPVIVGGLPGDRRSVVSTASYEARHYGVHSAMPISKAFQLCPDGIYLRGRMWRYHEKSIEVMNILKNYSPDIQQMSIDEAFVDLTGTERLFGKPEETAKKIKTEVKEKTGLTISVGIASNKYLAKIASGMSKPDGLYIVPDGEEEKFMLNLPLKDLWGAGTKTQERLKSAGIFTTKELHNCSESLLTTMFGQSAAYFLYNAVRGMPVKTFDEPVKSHSISNETTFTFDLTDRFAIETALLNLSTEIFFRMMDEKVSGKTVSVKLRYDDFSTFTIQDTSSSYISSSDDLYERAKRLLFKKYDTTRGIRLIGICIQNVDNNQELQQELFDFEKKKKQAVEKAVFEANKKNPGAKLNKARLLIKSLMFAFFFFLNLSVLIQKNFSQENAESNQSKNSEEQEYVFTIPIVNALQPEAPKSLFNYTKDSTNIEFITNGSWESKIFSGLKFTNDKNGFNFSFADFIFEQNVDLSMWFLLNKKFYVETMFQENFEKNTFAFGYYGTGILKHVRFGNNGISFPEEYSISSVGGGNIQSPGIMASLKGDTYRSDFILRYDNLTQKEKNYIGKHQITERKISVTDYETGKRFFLPEALCLNISEIYIQDKNGNLKDKNGRKLKKLSESEYLIKPSEQTITLNTATQNDILITFTENFSDALTQCKNLCINVENYFTECGIKNFSEYSLYSSDNAHLVTQIINGSKTENAVIIQCTPYFSPFWILDYYRAGTASYDEVKLISENSEITLSDFSVSFTNDSNLFTENDLIKSKATYAKLYSDTASETYSNSENRYPLSKNYPEIYINKKNSSLSDTVISFRTYTKVSGYDIGTNVLSGTVRVYKNGIQDSFFNYDEKSGKITLKTNVSENDKIKITWQEHDASSTIGTLTSALGFKKQFSEKNSLGIAAGIAWSLNHEKKFSTITDKAPGKIETSSDYSFTSGNFKLKNSLAFNIEQDDTTGLLQLLSFDEDIPKTSYLSSTCIYDISSDISPKLNGSMFPSLQKDKEIDFTSAHTIKDSEISGYGAEFCFKFTEEEQWCSKNIRLGNDKTKLASASKITIACKCFSKAKIYLQIGVEAEDNIIWENSDSIPTYEAELDNTNESWQELTFFITEEDRQKFTMHNDIRFIFYAQDNESLKENTIIIGPYEIEQINCGITSSFYADAMTQTETDTATPMLKTFNYDSTNYALNIKWNKSAVTDYATIDVYKYFPQTDVSSYENVNLFIYIPEDLNTNAIKNIKLSLDTNKTSSSFENSVSATIDKDILNNLKQTGSSYHNIRINIKEKKLFIDKKNIIGSEISVNKNILPTRFCLTINLEKEYTCMYSDSSIKIDNLYLSDSDITLNLKDKFTVQYEKKDTILKIKNFPVLSDINTNGEITGIYSINDNAFSYGALTSVRLNMLGIILDSNIYSGNIDNEILFNNISDFSKLDSANHKIETSSLIPAFKYINYTQFYNYNKTENCSEKIDKIKINIPIKNVPNNFSVSNLINYEDYLSSQKFLMELNITPEFNNFSYTIDAKLQANEKAFENTNLFNENNYFKTLYEISKLQFSNGNSNAKERKENLYLKQIFDFKKINFQPAISLNAQNDYTDSSLETNTAKTQIIYSFPFAIKKNKFNFEYSKELKTTNNILSGSKYTQDAKQYFSSLSDKSWFLKTIPFSDLFTKKFSRELQNTSELTSGYNATYSLNWKHNLYSNAIKNFFIPGAASFITSRDITHSLNGNTSDISQHKLSVQYSALNVFGKSSRSKVFQWYDHDEYISNYSIKFKINDNYSNLDSCSISGYNMITLFIKDKDSIQNIIDFQYFMTDNWNIKESLSFNRKTAYSLFTDIIYKIFSKMESEKTNLYRKDIFSSQWSKAEKLSSVTTYAHQLEIKFSNYVTVTAEANTSVIYQNPKTIQIIPGVSLTGKVSF